MGKLGESSLEIEVLKIWIKLLFLCHLITFFSLTIPKAVKPSTRSRFKFIKCDRCGPAESNWRSNFVKEWSFVRGTWMNSTNQTMSSAAMERECREVLLLRDFKREQPKKIWKSKKFSSLRQYLNGGCEHRWLANLIIHQSQLNSKSDSNWTNYQEPTSCIILDNDRLFLRFFLREHFLLFLGATARSFQFAKNSRWLKTRAATYLQTFHRL